jgi:hypothetical protein
MYINHLRAQSLFHGWCHSHYRKITPCPGQLRLLVLGRLSHESLEDAQPFWCANGCFYPSILASQFCIMIIMHIYIYILYYLWTLWIHVASFCHIYFDVCCIFLYQISINVVPTSTVLLPFLGSPFTRSWPSAFESTAKICRSTSDRLGRLESLPFGLRLWRECRESHGLKKQWDKFIYRCYQ